MENVDAFLLNYLSIDEGVEFDKEKFPNLVTIERNNKVEGTFESGIGYASTIGPRPAMEDTSLIYGNKDLGIEILTVFDGHAGSRAAEISVSSLQKYLKEDINLSLLSQKIDFNSNSNEQSEEIQKVFGKIQDELRKENVEDGCTTAMAIISHDKINSELIVKAIGIGDSRVVLVTKKGVIRMTKDAKPLERDEFKRLKEASLGVSCDGRIKRKLAVSRALGDFWCGDGLFIFPKINQKILAKNSEKIENPEKLQISEITDEGVGVVVACDGLWDVMNDEAVGEIVRKAKSGQEAASALLNSAKALQSMDNVSILVALFEPKEGFEGYNTTNVIERLPIIQIEEDSDDEPIFPTPQPARRRRR